jgi:3-hydroxybutyryl-CoA dehydratase
MKKFEIGQTDRVQIDITDDLICDMAKMSNDYNPIHMSDEYAEKSIFRKRIAHGLVCEALVSNLIGTKLPGPGAVFVEISFRFIKPVYIGDTITAVGSVKEVIPSKAVLLIDVVCQNQNGEIVTECSSKVKYLEFGR